MINAGLLALYLKKHYGIPYVVTEHSSAYATCRMGPFRIRRARVIARGAKKRFAVSNSLAEILKNRLGSSSGNWIEIPNSVNHLYTKRPLRHRKKNEDQFVFVSIGMLRRKKGVHYLISAFSRAFHGDLYVRLVIGGSGREMHKLKSLAKKLRVEKQVRFLGLLDRTEALKTVVDADAFVSASLFETFGVALVEALMLGKPVIATRCGGPESIVTSDNGILVPPGDVDALAKSMMSLKRNYHHFDPTRIREDCINRFSEETVTRRLTEVYHDILAENRKREGSHCKD